MNWYAVQRYHGYEGTHDKLFVFDTKRERDRFLEHGDRYSYELVIPWETFPVKASEAKSYAGIDDYGDKYACLYLGGVRYVWGQEGYESYWRERDERRTA